MERQQQPEGPPGEPDHGSQNIESARSPQPTCEIRKSTEYFDFLAEVEEVPEMEQPLIFLTIENALTQQTISLDLESAEALRDVLREAIKRRRIQKA